LSECDVALPVVKHDVVERARISSKLRLFTYAHPTLH
jgi:hypothetical protein